MRKTHTSFVGVIVGNKIVGKIVRKLSVKIVGKMSVKIVGKIIVGKNRSDKIIIFVPYDPNTSIRGQ